MDPNHHTYDDNKSVDSFSIPNNDMPAHYDYEFNSEKLDFIDEEHKNIMSMGDSINDGPKIGIDDSRELSRINRMYDIHNSDKHTSFRLEECIHQLGGRTNNSNNKEPIFGLEEDAELNEFEKVKIVNTIVTSQGGGRHTDYKIVGKWMDEKFIIHRRFKEFALLRKRLEERWPGFYIPPIPRKKTYGKMDSKVVSERFMILNRFLSELADRIYFWESEEMRIFVKPENNVSSELKILHRLSIEELLERIKQEAAINIQTNEIEIEEYQETMKNFKDKIVRNMPFLNSFKTFLVKQSNFVDDYQYSNGYLMDQLYTYENTSL
jgi:hypothetical protein